MVKNRREIAIYGKGGIGKSAITSNISLVLASQGYKVMQFGCDPKADSTTSLLNGKYIPTVLETALECETVREYKQVDVSRVIFKGAGGVLCVECGGPEPGRGCAGRGIITAVDLVRNEGIIDRINPDFVFYDVLGDVVCGGFATPIREGLAKLVYVVVSADYSAIYAANNIFKAIVRFTERGGASLGGLIANHIHTEAQRNIIERFAARTGTTVLEYLPHSLQMTEADINGKTVVELYPASEIAGVFGRLASRIAANEAVLVPEPMAAAELREWGLEMVKVSHGSGMG